ncbi:MAG: nicotinate-nucleotide adenylyltransferase [Candidatus Zixiibacteriota bacterium]
MARANPENGGRWGILGGTFDPVHRGHLILAREIYTLKKLDGILLVPAFHPPHKPKVCEASFADRLAMLNKAISGEEIFFISLIETEMNREGFTLNTVRALKEKYPHTEFIFIVGSDNIEAMRDWHRPEDIFREIKVVAGSRPGYENEPGDRFPGNKIEFVPTDTVDVASSSIRKMIKAGISAEVLTKLLPENVVTYIMEKRLYQ